MGSLLNRDEIRRLEKAAREKNKGHLLEWAIAFENGVSSYLKSRMKDAVLDEQTDFAEAIMIAITYTLYYSEETKMYCDKDKIAEFMCDLVTTVNMYRTGEYKPKEFMEKIKEVGIELDEYDYNKLYRDYIGTMDNSLMSMIKYKTREIITVIGNADKHTVELLEVTRDLTLQGFIVMTDNMMSVKKDDEVLETDCDYINSVMFDKILLSDKVYVLDKDLETREVSYIDYAKEHNKEIIVLNRSNSNED